MANIIELPSAEHDLIKRWVDRVPRFKSYMELNHMMDCKALRRRSRLCLDYDGDMSYTSKEDYVVHIGVWGIVERNLLWIESDEDLLAVLEFVRHHEVLHLFYTGGDSYAWAIQRGTREVLTYIGQAKYGKPPVFRKESDEARFRQKLDLEYQCRITYIIDQTSANICNCLCDGRIERIGASEPTPESVNPPFRGKQFAAERTLNRGRNFYETGNEVFVPYEEVADSPADHLRIIINQILMLSKCQVYQKGFVEAYGDTPMMEEMARINEGIRIGYLGSDTKAIAEANTIVCRELAPLIFSAAEASAEDAKQAEMLRKLLSQLIKSLQESGEPANSDSDANSDTSGASNSALPSNDLMSSASQGQKGEEGEEQNSGSGNSGADGGDSETGSDSGSDSSSESGKGVGKEGQEKDSDGSNNGQSGSSSDGSDDQSGSDDSDSSASSDGGSNSDHGHSKSDGSKKSGNGNGENADDAIQKAMDEARDKSRAINSAAIDSINQAAKAGADAERADAKRVSQKIKKVDPSDVADICGNFSEHRRKYDVCEQLPPVKLQDGKVFRKWFEKFLKSKKTPSVKNRQSGKLDRKALANLAKKDTHVFMKNSKNALRRCCVYILVDNSGSMSGAKRQLACEAAGVIEEGIKYTVPTKIVAFDEYGNIIHEVIKDWDEVFVNNCCWSFCLHGRDGNGNDDGYDIDIATHEILQRPEERKILIVLSDGAPADTDHVKRAVEDARKKGIKVCGIYFEEGDTVRWSKDFIEMYQKDYVCCTADKIQENLTKIVETFLKG